MMLGLLFVLVAVLGIPIYIIWRCLQVLSRSFCGLVCWGSCCWRWYFHQAFNLFFLLFRNSLLRLLWSTLVGSLITWLIWAFIFYQIFLALFLWKVKNTTLFSILTEANLDASFFVWKFQLRTDSIISKSIKSCRHLFFAYQVCVCIDVETLCDAVKTLFWNIISIFTRQLLSYFLAVRLG